MRRSRSSDRDYDDRWPAYVPVAEKKAQAAQKLASLQKKGEQLEPVVIDGAPIARTFWGKSWCKNLEAYSDFASRLPRGRSYVRNGAVIDLKLEPGCIHARVMGSALYKVDIQIDPLDPKTWEALCQEVAGRIDSLIELLQGKLSNAVMEVLTRPGKGMFPRPKEVTFKCSCPDGAWMCKHVAAVLYGVGARLDTKPELFFTLRKVDQADLVGKAGAAQGLGAMAAQPSERRLDDDSLSSLFGIDLAGEDGPGADPMAGSSLTALFGGEGAGAPSKSGTLANSGATAKSGAPVKSAVPAKSGASAKSGMPARSAAPAKSAAPARAAAPGRPAALAKAAKSATPAKYTAPGISTTPATSVKPSIPIEPSNSAASTNPVAVVAGIPVKPGSRLAARKLTTLGVPHATIQNWLRSGVLVHSGERGVYLTTASTREKVAQYLEGAHPPHRTQRHGET